MNMIAVTDEEFEKSAIPCNYCGVKFNPEWSHEPIKDHYVCPNCDRLNP